MHETVTQLGSDRRLVGILTTPSAYSGKRIACLLINAGVVHRIGPHRLNVKLARLLAQKDIPSLRFDLSGLGDSAPVSGRANFREDQPVADLQTAMDYLEREKDIRRFLVLGICSGAVNGFALALSDPRVIGLLMFDGFWFPTAKTYFVRRWTRFRSLSWGALFSKITHKVSAALAGSKRPTQNDSSNEMSRERFAQGMSTLVGRGVNVFVFYSGSFLEKHNYDGQLQDAFRGEPFVSRIRCDYRRHIDHTVTPIAAQQEWLREVSAWCGEVAAAPEFVGTSALAVREFDTRGRPA